MVRQDKHGICHERAQIRNLLNSEQKRLCAVILTTESEIQWPGLLFSSLCPFRISKEKWS